MSRGILKSRHLCHILCEERLKGFKLAGEVQRWFYNLRFSILTPKNSRILKFAAIKVLTTFSYLLGKCHTYIPQAPVNRVGKYFGYNISMTYDKAIKNDNKPKGWHIYIHDADHEFHGKLTQDL